jgi:CubicO group peptidase (beta-lactamase class C family)
MALKTGEARTSHRPPGIYMLRDVSLGFEKTAIAMSLGLVHCAPELPPGSWESPPAEPTALAAAALRSGPALQRDSGAQGPWAIRRHGSIDSLVREPIRLRRQPAPVRQTSGPASDVPRRFRALAETIEAERIAQGIPGLSVAIVEGGKLTFARGFGTKDPDGDDPVRPSTLFRLASNTKPFTAVSVLQQVERGALGIDDALVSHLPEFGLDATPEPVPSITLRQLLSHASGLADYLDVDVPESEKTDAALGALLLGPYRGIGYVQASPGALFSYSNVGYSLLGLVAEVETSIPFRALVRERIWAPLGMKRTFFEPSAVLVDGDYALGTCPPDAPECAGEGLGSVFAPDSYDAPSSAPAAASWSSVLDLAKWARFLVHGDPRVLGDDLRAQMAEPQISTRFAGDLSSYGLGLQLQSVLVARPEPGGPAQFYDAREIYHGGALPGFRSTLTCAPSLDFCFVGLANYSDVDFFPMEAEAFGLAALPEPITAPDIAPVPERFPEYAGVFLDPFLLGVMAISLDEAGAHIDFPALDQLGIPYGRDLTPANIDSFAFDVDGDLWPLTFLRGASGGFDYVRAFDRYVATRFDPSEVPSVAAVPFDAPERGARLREALERPNL